MHTLAALDPATYSLQVWRQRITFELHSCLAAAVLVRAMQLQHVTTTSAAASIAAAGWVFL